MIQKNYKKTLPYFIFLVSPIFALFFAIRNFSADYAKNILWLFCAFFGFTFVISSEGIYAAVYSSWLVELHNNYNVSLSDYLFDGSKTDYFNAFLTYCLAYFTDDYRILFATYGLVFGFFYSRNIWILLENVEYKVKLISILSLVLFIFLIPFWNINGFRFYAGAQIFLYGVLNYFISDKKIFLFFCLFACLVHFGYVLPLGSLIFVLVVGDRHYMYFIFFVLSMTILQIGVETFLNLLPQISDSYDAKASSYTGEAYMAYRQKAAANASWFLLNRIYWLNYVFLAFGTYIFLFKRKFIKKIKLAKLFYLGVLILGLANMLSIIPSSIRFLTIGHTILAAFMFLYLQKTTKHYWMNRQISIYSLPIIAYLIVEFRISLQYIGLNTIFTNPLVVWILDNKIPLIDFYPF